MANADFLDNAAELTAAESESRLREQLKQHNFDKPSNTHCAECDEEIPQERRKLGGVKLCVDCEIDRVKRINLTGVA